MKKGMHYAILLLFPIFFICQCKNDDDLSDEAIVNIFDIDKPTSIRIIDTINNTLYFFGEAGEIIKYNYEEHETIAITNAPHGIRSLETGVANGIYNGEREIYIGYQYYILVLNQNTLAIKDTVFVIPEDYSGYICGVEFSPPNKLMATVCNVPQDDDLGRGIRVYDRTNGALISNLENNGFFNPRIESYALNNDTTVIIGVATGQDYLGTVKIDATGNPVADNSRSHNFNGVSSKIIATNDVAAYFIAGRKGNFILKESLDLFGSVTDDYYNYIITSDGKVIYGLSESGEVVKIEYPNLEITDRLSVESNARYGFIDEGQLHLLHFSYTANGDQRKIYLSKHDVF